MIEPYHTVKQYHYHTIGRKRLSMTETLRLFIAIDLSAEVKTLLGELQAQLRQHTDAVRWSDPAGTHLTLKFLGSTPATRLDAIVEGLRRVVTSHAAFQLETTGLGVFPNARRPRVLWLGISGDLPALQELQSEVELQIAPLGFPTEDRAFSPHLTLGRSVKDPAPAQLASIRHALEQTKAPPAIKWDVSEVVLMRSELLPRGPRYTAVEHMRLDGQS